MAYTTEINVNGVLTPVVHLDISAQDMEDSIERAQFFSNPNLLDNWYFAAPINQRLGTTYTASGYTIDRWRSTSGAGSVSVETGKITIKGISGNLMLRQLIADPEQYYGMDITVSALTADISLGNILVTATGHIPSEPFSTETTIARANFNADGSLYFALMLDANGRLYAQLRAGAGQSLSVYAVKLELGRVQTLARQDSFGNWTLLGSPPNKDLEFLKCQRYQLVIPATATRYLPTQGNANVFDFAIPVPVSMRATPVIASGIFTVDIIDAAGTVTSSGTGFNFSLFAAASNAIVIRASKSNHGYDRQNVLLRVSGAVILDANL